MTTTLPNHRRRGRVRRAGPPGPALVMAWLAAALLQACDGAAEGAGAERDPARHPALAVPLDDSHPDVVAAIEEARAEVVAARDDASAWGRLGMTYQANGLFEPARACYAEAAARDAAPARWLYLAARAARDEGRDVEALDAARRAVAADATCAGAAWLVGQTHLEAGELAEARAAFEDATRFAPENPAGWCGLARVALLEDRPGEALAGLERVLAAAPTHAYAHNLAALALRRLERTQEALEHARLGVDGLPDWQGPWDLELRSRRVATGSLRWEVASDLFDAGRYPAAIEVLEGVHREEPENRGLATFLARAYVRAGRLHEARRLFDQVLEAEAENRDALVGLADVLIRLDELEAAEALVERAIELHPEYGRAHHVHGVLLKRRGATAEAVEAFRRSLYHDQRNPTTRLSIGALELELRRWSDAAATFEAAVEAGAPPAEAWLGLAQARVRLGDVDGAEDALRRAAASPDADARELERVRADLRRERGRRGA